MRIVVNKVNAKRTARVFDTAEGKELRNEFKKVVDDFKTAFIDGKLKENYYYELNIQEDDSVEIKVKKQ